MHLLGAVPVVSECVWPSRCVDRWSAVRVAMQSIVYQRARPCARQSGRPSAFAQRCACKQEWGAYHTKIDSRTRTCALAGCCILLLAGAVHAAVAVTIFKVDIEQYTGAGCTGTNNTATYRVPLNTCFKSGSTWYKFQATGRSNTASQTCNDGDVFASFTATTNATCQNQTSANTAYKITHKCDEAQNTAGTKVWYIGKCFPYTTTPATLAPVFTPGSLEQVPCNATSTCTASTFYTVAAGYTPSCRYGAGLFLPLLYTLGRSFLNMQLVGTAVGASVILPAGLY